MGRQLQIHALNDCNIAKAPPLEQASAPVSLADLLAARTREWGARMQAAADRKSAKKASPALRKTPTKEAAVFW